MAKNSIFFINGQEYSPKKPLIIAELGTSHGLDPVKASELVDAAAESGANCIKFQMVFANEILHPNTGIVELPGGSIPLYDRFKQLEAPLSFYAEMKERVEKSGLVFLCTPFGMRSARELKSLNPACIKIASPELNYTKLLEEISLYDLPVLLSSGVSRLADIEAALDILLSNFTPERKAETKNTICLLHCVTSYPAPETDYNLSVLKNLSRIFGLPAGISDHSLDPVLVPALALSQGACVIEKHFCLSRDDPGLDDPIALPPKDFEKMCSAVRKFESYDEEKIIGELSGEYGKDLIEKILGDGIKRLAPSEENNYSRTNRSVHALREIKEGETITAEMIASLRTEKILRPGLPPSFEKLLPGLRARQDIPNGEGIRWEDLF